MNTKLLIGGLVLTSVLASGFVIGDDDYEDRAKRFWRESSLDVAPVDNALYAEECGACHFAYQPGLLPARSWRKIMDTLADHFGENAELGNEEAIKLSAYLITNAADHSGYKRSSRIAGSLKADDAPLRFTETRYFQRQHHELSKRMVEDNPQVKSFSRCGVCHTQADKGSYNEHEVKIPGFAHWED